MAEKNNIVAEYIVCEMRYIKKIYEGIKLDNKS